MELDIMSGSMELRAMQRHAKAVEAAGFSTMWLTEAGRTAYLSAAAAGLVTERLGLEGDIVTKSATRALVQSHAKWSVANERREKLRWSCHELFRDIDVLLTPVTPVAAFTHRTSGNQLTRRISVDGKSRPYADHIPWIALATVASLPATSAPAGRTPEGLPVNIQIVGPYLGDRTTLRFAELLRDVCGGFVAPPI